MPSSCRRTNQTAKDTVMEKGNAEPTIKGAILSKNRMLPIHAPRINQPLKLIPIAIRAWPAAIARTISIGC
ncbi:MAG: hypothetical protein IPI77_18165 [Saprospiraceae bacterium]|nr:hypothetical protein [Saprospiraceae bacterium]